MEHEFGEWIPCDYELPEEEDCYLVAWVPKDDRYRGRHYYEILSWEDGEWEDNIPQSKPYGFEVIAWMPLPDRYVEEDEE